MGLFDWFKKKPEKIKEEVIVEEGVEEVEEVQELEKPKPKPKSKPKKPEPKKKIVASVLFTDGKHVLLLKRAKQLSSLGNFGTWDLPGGRVDAGENLKRAAIRETLEECGFPAMIGKPMSVVDISDKKAAWKVFVYRVKDVKNIEVKLSPEHNAYKWFPLKGLKKADIHPRMKRHLKKLLSFI